MPAHVVQQFMIEPRLPAIRAVLPIHANHGAGQRVPRAALASRTRFMGRADRVVRLTNRPSAQPTSLCRLAQRPHVATRTAQPRTPSNGGTIQSP